MAKTYDGDLQLYLTQSNIAWRLLEESTQFDAEAEWRSIFGRGTLVPLGEFCEAEFFVSPLDFEWTMVQPS